MISPKWRKALRDLSLYKMRSFLVILAMIIGVFGISVVANSYSILLREMNRNYMDTNPSSATLATDLLNPTIVEQIRSYPGIKDAETRERIVGRVQVGENEWKDIWLFVVDDFNNIRLDTFTNEEGAAIPAPGEILFERKAMTFTGAAIGQPVNIKIPGSAVTTLQLTGSVHAPGLAPAWMEGFAYGFITHDTYLLLGGMEEQTEIKIQVNEHTMDKAHIRDTAYNLKAFLEEKGFSVYRIDIPEPGRHPHYTQMATLLYLMEVFGLLALVLSGVLVSNMITSILEQQVRQIGIMKAIGAGSGQILRLYLGIVIFFSLIAMAVGIPAGIYAGRGYAWIAAEILNFKIVSYHIPAYIFLLEAAVGILIPVFICLLPIRKASRVTVRKAIQDYGISDEKYSSRVREKSSRFLTLFPRPFLLSLRNTFRRKGRLLFTILVMAVGGTGFIIAMNIYASMYNTVDRKIDAFSYDIQLTFEQPHKISDIDESIRQVPGIESCEAWGGALACRVYEDNTTGNSFSLIAPASDTKLMTVPPLYEGRWLTSDDSNAIVLNQRVLSAEPDIRVGDEIILRINGKDVVWNVVGISKELIGLPTAYVSQDYLAELLGAEGCAKSAVIVTSEHNSVSCTEAAKHLEQDLASKGLSVSSLTKLSDYRKSLTDHLTVIASFLVIMSMLIVLVGGLGLATTISINTMERTREIGIMKAMGAQTYYLTGMIVTEGVLIGVLSWVVSLILSLPLSRVISYRFGMIFFEAPLEFAPSIPGYIIWLFIVILFAVAASFYPSYKASKMPVRDALAYE